MTDLFASAAAHAGARAASCFAPDYRAARSLFLQSRAQLPLHSYLHPLRGAQGETLALDVVLAGAPQADKILLISSACHGVEGFHGSALQSALLQDAALLAAARAGGVTILLLHALNPWGFSHLRRVDHQNIDLNRNFIDFAAPPANPQYSELHALLLPPVWPPDAANQAALGAWMHNHGLAAFQAAISMGQYSHPDGMFYGGAAPSWSQQTLRAVLRRYAAHARELAWLDIHSGLGPQGVAERMFDGREDDLAACRRAQEWWGGETPVTTLHDGNSSSSRLHGLMHEAAYQECAQARFTGLTLEYGTEDLLFVLQALRADHRLAQPAAMALAPAQAAAIRATLRQAFYSDNEAWRQAVMRQGMEVIVQGVQALAAL
ncbi:M14 family metallopeptidase [Massilia sp. W12]|uniref:M14 family metallopeptidase n=1 Tax=Massilia sp. W12 TaxID=3126507 RepID=UPI0030D3FE66